MSQAKLIFQGFSTLANFDGQQLLCETVSLNEAVASVDSGAGYGANQTGADMALNVPYFLDYGEVSGSLSYNLTSGLCSSLISWMGTRNIAKRIKINTGPGSEINMPECYWTSIGFAATMDSLLTGTMNFYSNSRAVADGIFGGIPTEYGLGFNPSGLELIPWYNTAFGDYETLDWTFTINQDVLKKFFCEGLNSEQSPTPKYIIVGLPSADLQATILTALDPVIIQNFLLDYTGVIDLNLSGAHVIVSKATLMSFTPHLEGGYHAIDITLKTHHIQ